VIRCKRLILLIEYANKPGLLHILDLRRISVLTGTRRVF